MRNLTISEADVMGLPVKFNNVHYYRISGRYIFGGDLFIARRTIYFFPEVDLAEQRTKSSEYLPHRFALIMLAIMYLVQKLGSYASRNDLWEQGISDEQLQKKADAYIEELKDERRDKVFSESLPLPTHVSIDEISDIKLSLTGKLSFLAQSDNHDFNIGLRRKKRLRDALWEGGFGKT
jgi:hypothetical protein